MIVGRGMKTVYLIGGTMGVGKTAACQELKKKLNNAVFLDGDWCWDADPFVVTEETKKMVTENICFLLNQFIHCTAYENIIFCWVIHEQPIIDGIVSRLDLSGCVLKIVSLVCTPKALRERLSKDVKLGIREPDIIERSVARIHLYEKLKTVKIDVSDISASDAADAIAALS